MSETCTHGRVRAIERCEFCEVERLKAELEQEKAHCTEYVRLAAQGERDADTLRAENARLREALERYGKHDLRATNCLACECGKCCDSKRDCICGFRTALSAPAKEGA